MPLMSSLRDSSRLAQDPQYFACESPLTPFATEPLMGSRVGIMLSAVARRYKIQDFMRRHNF
ncbi:hypothetical protein FA13DRAFT_1733468 [Coprinellus micaceus]|uniref:Uncharacterized protein n=1 Tax=Coprinellus micaceus TaxID=71717 RepID=A0A4Y7TAI7_COPMI|nr:hypothetical protein FA13DRAFT_1733468 [Coprinellus micaceus]